MSNKDMARVVLQMQAEVGRLRRDMDQAAQVVEGSTNKMERASRKAAKGMERNMSNAAVKMGGVFKNFGAGLFAGIAAGGVAGIVTQFGQVAKSVAEIGDQAKRAGVSSRVFQEWATVATQARIPVDALTDGLKELALRGDEFAITGKGGAAEAFTRLGYSAAELKTKLEDPSTLLLEIIERLGQFDKAAQIRISDELFGGSAGERFVELLDRGAAGIRATIDEAHRFGNILDDEVIKRAAEVDRQFAIVSQTVGTALKGAIVDAAAGLQDFINMFNGFEAQRDASLASDVSRLGRERMDVETKILELREKQASGKTIGDGWFGTSVGETDFGTAFMDLERRKEALAAEEEMITRILEQRRKLRETPPSTGGGTDWTPPPYTPPPPGGGRDKAAADAEREAEAVRRLIGELEHELQLVGATDLERETSNLLRQAGAAATDEQKAKIVSLVAALHAEEEATRKATDAAMELRDIGRDVLGGLISDMIEGKSAADSLADALGNIGDRLLNSGLDALFGGGGGGCFGGAVFNLNLRRAA